MIHQVCLLKSLNIRRRDLLRLLFSSSAGDIDDNDNMQDDVQQDEVELINFEEDEDDDDYLDVEGIYFSDVQYEQLSDVSKLEQTDLVSVINETIWNQSSDSNEPELHHVGANLLILKRNFQENNDDDVSMVLHHGLPETDKHTNDLKLSKSMLTDHLPDGGYNDLFENIGEQSVHINLTLFKDLVQQQDKRHLENINQDNKGKWGRFKSKVKDFFKGIG